MLEDEPNDLVRDSSAPGTAIPEAGDLFWLIGAEPPNVGGDLGGEMCRSGGDLFVLLPTPKQKKKEPGQRLINVWKKKESDLTWP